MKKAEKIFIIGDNAGEIVFDKLLIEILLQKYPGTKFIYAVRGGPAINDVIMEDAVETGLSALVEVVQGSVSPGVIMEETTPEFREVFQTADLIISKGQGNFESLDTVDTNGVELYFLLKAKCEVVAEMFNVPLGSLVLSRRRV